MKINFENSDYDLKVSWYKNNHRLCVFLKNDDEEICITTNDNTIKIDTPNITLLDSFISNSPLLKELANKNIITGYKEYDFFEAVSFDLNILAEYDPIGTKQFLELLNI